MSTLSKAVADAIRQLYPRSHVRMIAGEVPKTDALMTVASQYRTDPVGYATNVLKVSLTPDQENIFRALPGRVKVNSGHGTGKTFMAAVAASWWFDTRDPGVVITTAPTERDVVDLLWTEIRLQRGRAGLPSPFVGPRSAEMFDHDGHWAKGYTARRSESFQGRHRPSMFFIFDESEAVDAPYWLTLNTMYQPDADHAALAIGNPTTNSSQSYLEDMMRRKDGTPKWTLFTLSALNHPNISAQLKGEPPPIPDAVTLGQIDQYLEDWATKIPENAKIDSDFQWPPGSGAWYRPGPNFKSRVQGIRPTEGVDTVWSTAAFENACVARWDPQDCWRRNFGITVGIDSGGYGDDDTAIHVRTGPLSLHHESRNGWEPGQAAGRAKELICQWVPWYNAFAYNDRPPLKPEDVEVVLEFDGGYGVGVHSHRGDDYPNWYGITVGSNSEVIDPNGRPMYANVRAEIWFEAASSAKGGQIDLSRLPQETRDKLRIQLVTPFYENLPNGTKRVEPKRDVKKRLGRSPDDADAFLISHYRRADWAPTVLGK